MAILRDALCQGLDRHLQEDGDAVVHATPEHEKERQRSQKGIAEKVTKKAMRTEVDMLGRNTPES